MQDFIVTLTNASKATWPYAVKATTEEKAIKAAKKLHHHVPGMPKTQVVSIEEDSRTSHQRAHDIASERSNNWQNSLEYRYGPMLNEPEVKTMLTARVNSMYHEVYERYIMQDFSVWLKSKSS